MNKYIKIFQDDKFKLERFLNEQSEAGYHAEKINMFRIKFSEDPNIRYYYKVMYPQSIVEKQTKYQDIKKQALFLSDFGLELISTTVDLIIYRSDQEINIYTDPTIDKNQEKIALKKGYRNSFVYIIIALTNMFPIVIDGPYRLLISNINMFMFFTNILFSIFGVMRIFKAYQLMKGKHNNKLGYRWKLKSIDPIFIYLISLLTFRFFQTGTQAGYIFIGLVIVFILLEKQISKSKIKEKKQFLILLSLGIISVSILTTVVVNFYPKNTDNIYISESFLAKETTGINHSYTVVVEIKNKSFSKFIRSEFFKKHGITPPPQSGQIVNSNSSFSYFSSIYWDDSLIIASVDDITENQVQEYK